LKVRRLHFHGPSGGEPGRVVRGYDVLVTLMLVGGEAVKKKKGKKFRSGAWDNTK